MTSIGSPNTQLPAAPTLRRCRALPSALAAALALAWAGSAHAACPTSAGGTPSFSAEPVNVVITAEATGGDEFQALVVMKNSGDPSWCQTGDFPVRVDLDAASKAAGWGLAAPVEATVAEVRKNANGLFQVELTAPPLAGLASLAFELHYEDSLGTPVTFGTATPAETVDVVCAAGHLAGGDNALILTHDSPPDVEVGSSFTARATVRNTGSNCWRQVEADGSNPAKYYLIGRNDPGTPQPWPAPFRHFPEDDLLPVKPGDEIDIEYQVGTPGSLTSPPAQPFEAQMIRQAGGGWFGNKTSNTLTLVSAGTLDADFVEADHPSVVVPGETYTVRVTYRNTGSRTWIASGIAGEGIGLAHANDSAVGNDWGSVGRQKLPHDVLPNQNVTFEFSVFPDAAVDPTTVDYSAMQWRMLDSKLNNPSGIGRFGETSPAYDPAVRDMRYRITTQGDLFIHDDPNASTAREYVMRGFNYLPFYDFDGAAPLAISAQNNAWTRYSEEVTEREFREMAALGANTVRFWAPNEYLGNNPGTSVTQTEACTRLDHALDSAYRNGLRVVLSLPVNQRLIFQENCPTGSTELCDRNMGSVAKVSTLFFEDGFRTSTIDGGLQILEDCSVLQNADTSSRPPRLFALEFWQEPSGGDNNDRRNLSPAREWHEYVVDTHCVPDSQNPNKCCLPSDPTCDVQGALADAFGSSVWDYSQAIDCGNPQGTPGLETYLCPPDGEELCTGDSSAAWREMTEEYRRFVDDRAHDAYADALTGLDGLMDDLGLPTAERPMVTLGFASLFARSDSDHERLCGGDEAVAPPPGSSAPPNAGRGYFLDPRFGEDLFDYASIHLYPWSDLSVDFNAATSSTDPDVIALAPADRYHQMRYLLDYVRTDRPVVMEETGYNTCNGSDFEAIRSNGGAVGNPSGCVTPDARDLVQEEVWQKEAESLAQVQANGALFWVFRDRVDRAHWGARRLDDTEKPVYDDIPQILLDLEAGRDLPTNFVGCLAVDPYALPNWNASLMESFGDYLTEASLVGGYGPVEIRIAPDACP